MTTFWIVLIGGVVVGVLYLLLKLAWSKNKTLKQQNDYLHVINKDNAEKTLKDSENTLKKEKFEKELREKKVRTKPRTTWVIFVIFICVFGCASNPIYRTVTLDCKCPRLRIYDRPELPTVDNLKCLVEEYEEDITEYNKEFAD